MLYIGVTYIFLWKNCCYDRGATYTKVRLLDRKRMVIYEVSKETRNAFETWGPIL